MAISLTGGSRAKLNQTLTFSTSVAALTPIEDTNKILIPVHNPTFAADEFTVTADLTNTSADVVGTNNAFANVRVGDVVTNANITGGTATVIAKTDNNNIELSAVATGDASGETLTITPGTIGSTFYIMELKNELTGSKLKITPTLYYMDGTKVLDGTVLDDKDNATVTDAAGSQVYSAFTIDLDAFYTNARNARKDS